MMQRETLTQHWSVDEVRRFSADQFGSTSGGQADPKLVGELADRIINAEHPILITAYAGRNPRAAQAIAELSEFAGIAVIESNASNNIPNTLPCFVGYSADKQVPKADLGILVDIDVPWFPSDVQPKADSFWAHIDIDILKPASPMWTFPGNLRMQGDSGHILTQLLEELKKKATPAFKQKAAARVEQLKTEHAAFVERAAKLAADKGKKNEINPHYLMAELNKVLDAKDVVFNEAIRNAGAVSMQIKRSQAEHDDALGRRRARLVRRFRARRQARGARSHDGAGGRRRQLLFRQSELGVLRLAAVQAADPHRRDRQHRLGRGESVDAARVPERRSRRRRRVPVDSSCRTSISARSPRRSAPMAKRSPIRTRCRRRSRAASRKCAADARRSCMHG